MGKTTYSRNPSTSKGIFWIIKLPNLQPEILESIIKTPMRLPKPSKAFPLPRPSNILRMFWGTEDASLTLNITEESAEPDKPHSSAKLLEDGLRNQSRLFWVSLITSNPTPTLRTLKTWPLTTSKLIEQLKAAEGLTGRMVESAPIFPRKHTFKYSLLRKPLT